MLAMLKGHERLRAVAAMAVVAEGDMGCDHRGSSSRGHRGLSSERVGEKLSYRTRILRLLGIEVATWIVRWQQQVSTRLSERQRQVPMRLNEKAARPAMWTPV
ncbi:hypothetical protein GW17_00044211 [Ensete ventricosum]|nr:hypothetical protein GW17_00044211 [Ensete ventricosum]